MSTPTTNTSAYKPGAAGGLRNPTAQHLLRVGAGMLSVILIVLCVQTGTAYFSANDAVAQTERWFSGQSKADEADLEIVQKNLESVDSAILDDATIKLALAKLYFVRGQHNQSDVYFEAAHKAISDVQLMQPSHFEALALRVVLDDYLDEIGQDTLSTLRKLLTMGPFEREVQKLVGPILVKRWFSLPPDIHSMAEPLITSALREKSAKAVLMNSMARYHIVLPFFCCSPNQETSDQLSHLETSIRNATVR